MIILGNRLLETGLTAAFPTPAVGVVEGVAAFALVVSIRAYAGTVVAGELTGEPVTVREGLYRSLARTPALIGVVLLVAFSVLVIPSLVSLPLLLLLGLTLGSPVGVVGFPLTAAVGVLVVAVPSLFLLFKFWFAPEACVIGQYGPIEALEVSWRLTTNYRGRFALIIVIVIGSAISTHLPTAFLEFGTGSALVSPVLSVASASVGELLSVAWASAYAHTYVKNIVL
ncbi:hypothetical protein [Halobellus salinus]|uniref:hypothetical protein n=1 Tax=Halobellus salinus TaxID=931585 RepID=UPI001665FDFE|nr:hypothetical protein [Halobellus salinus]